MKNSYPISFTPVETDPKYKNLNHVKNGKLGQLVLRDIGRGMSPRDFDEYKANLGPRFTQAVQAIKTQEPRTNEFFLKRFAEYIWLWHLHKDHVNWSDYPCLFKNSNCFTCEHRACNRSTPDFILEILEREHCRRLHLQEKQSTGCCCPHHQA